MSDSTATQTPYPVFLPILLVVLALCLMTGFQTLQLQKESELLNARLQAQTEPLKESTKVREQLQSIAAGTADLAAQGNENAKQILALLQRSGITVNRDKIAEEQP